MITHHPEEEVLVAYAAGASNEAISLVVSTHLALCPGCRREVRDAESAGGALLEGLEPASVSDTALASVTSRLDGLPLDLPPGPAARNGHLAPEPLRSYLGGDLDAVRWTRVARGLYYRPIFKRGRSSAQLVRSRPGRGVSLHSHRSEEFSLVLTGGYTDPTGHYVRGDVQCATPELSHHPVADEGEDCIILAATDAPLVFRNPLVGLLARLVGY